MRYFLIIVFYKEFMALPSGFLFCFPLDTFCIYIKIYFLLFFIFIRLLYFALYIIYFLQLEVFCVFICL